MNEIIWLVLVISTKTYAMGNTVYDRTLKKEWFTFQTSSEAVSFVQEGKAMGESYFFKATKYHLNLSDGNMTKGILGDVDSSLISITGAMCFNKSIARELVCALREGHKGNHKPHTHEICALEWE